MKSGGVARVKEAEGDTVTNESDYKLHFPALILIRLSFLSPVLQLCSSYSLERSGRSKCSSGPPLLFLRPPRPTSIYPPS